MSKESVQQTANLGAIVKYCKSNIQKWAMTHLSLKPKFRVTTSLAKCLSVRLRTKWLLARIPLRSQLRGLNF